MDNHTSLSEPGQPVFNVPLVILWFSALLVLIHGLREWYFSAQEDLEILIGLFVCSRALWRAGVEHYLAIGFLLVAYNL